MSDKSKDDLETQDKLKSDDYEVGFQKPPAKSRFQPGSSGNPKGRPHGSKNKTSLKFYDDTFINKLNNFFNQNVSTDSIPEIKKVVCSDCFNKEDLDYYYYKKYMNSFSNDQINEIENLLSIVLNKY